MNDKHTLTEQTQRKPCSYVDSEVQCNVQKSDSLPKEPALNTL